MLEFKDRTPSQPTFRGVLEVLQSFDFQDKLIMLFVLLMALSLPGQAIYKIYKDHTSKVQWEEFRSAHACKITVRHVGAGTADEPESTDWLCEDGVTYNVTH